MTPVQPQLRENMRVRLEFPHRKPGVSMSSRIEWIVKDRLGLAAPADEDAVAVEPEDMVVMLVVVGARTHRSVTKVLGRVFSPIPCIEVATPQSWERIEKRVQFRVRAVLDVHFDTREVSEEPIVATTRDISGGGLQLHVAVNSRGYSVARGLTIGQVMVLRLDLPDRELNSVAEVVRKEERETGILLSAKFAAIGEADRERLIRYCFAAERKAMRKGLVLR